MGPIGNLELFEYLNPLLFYVFDLFAQGHRVNDHAGTDYIGDVLAEYSGRDGMQHVFFIIKYQRVPRVGPTLKPAYIIIICGQAINYLTFPFVTPLETQNNIYRHMYGIRLRLKTNRKITSLKSECRLNVEIMRDFHHIHSYNDRKG